MYEAAFKAMLEIKKKELDDEEGLVADVDDADEMFEFFGFHDGLDESTGGDGGDRSVPVRR